MPLSGLRGEVREAKPRQDFRLCSSLVSAAQPLLRHLCCLRTVDTRAVGRNAKFHFEVICSAERFRHSNATSRRLHGWQRVQSRLIQSFHEYNQCVGLAPTARRLSLSHPMSWPFPAKFHRKCPRQPTLFTHTAAEPRRLPAAYVPKIR